MTKEKIDTIEKKSLILPFLAMEKFVLSPVISQPVKLETEEQMAIANRCYSNNSKIFIGTAEPLADQPDKQEIRKLGLVCEIERFLQMPGAPTLIFVKPLFRASYRNTIYNPEMAMARVDPLKNVSEPRKISKETEALIQRIRELLDVVFKFMIEPEKLAAEKLIEENSYPLTRRLYAISHVAPLLWGDKYLILECNTFSKLINTLAILLDEAEQKISLQARIHERTHHEITQQQKETFLRIHLKQIQEELGETDELDDISDLKIRAKKMVWSADTAKHFEKELRKLRRLNINNPEYSVQYAYLESFLELPWEKYSNSDLSLVKVEEILNRDHFGLKKVKERILEYMSVVKLRNDLKAPILCLYGPPGVGKTSIGKSVAEATGREYARISLGGMHDEAEIRGHRRTYIGAMPGRFLHALSKCNFGNALILLDEIDKVGKDYKGDPSSALLEALDPEQNNTFHDNFIDFPYDLSKVLFIATANDLSTIPAPLRDRMEIIEMPGYALEEKREIALRHLIDKALTENGFEKGEIKFTNDALDTIIRSFTNEKGVRQLSQVISRLIRKMALRKVKGKEIPNEITADLVKSLISKDDFSASTSHVGFRL